MRNDLICEITVQTKGIWSPGVMAVEHIPTGRRFYIGTTDLGRRLRDNRDWLLRGTHPNRALQLEWSQHPDEFRFALVQRVEMEGLVQMMKQAWIDRDRRDGPSPYNVKNAMPKERPRRPPDFSLPLDIFYEPPPIPPVDVYDRLLAVLGEDVFAENVADDGQQEEASTGPSREDRDPVAEALLDGLPSAEANREVRVEELIKRMRQLSEEGGNVG